MANYAQYQIGGNKNGVVYSGCTLSISKQSSLEVEKFTENGQQRNVHYVVKNTAFTFELALVNLQNASCSYEEQKVGQDTLDFNKLSVQAVLLYDCPGTQDKEVGCVKVDPLSYRGVISSSNPLVYQIETVIKILSSQHEDMNFKIKFVAVDSYNRPLVDIPPVYSDSINVISKPGVLQKIRDKQLQVASRTKSKKNKSKSDLTMEALARIERSLTDQQAKIDLLMSERNAVLPKLGKRPPLDSGKDSLTTACLGFLNEVQNIQPCDRPEKIRKVRNSLSQDNLMVMQEFFQDLISPSSTATPCGDYQPSMQMCSLESLDDDLFSILDAVLKS